MWFRDFNVSTGIRLIGIHWYLPRIRYVCLILILGHLQARSLTLTHRNWVPLCTLAGPCLYTCITWIVNLIQFPAVSLERTLAWTAEMKGKAKEVKYQKFLSAINDMICHIIMDCEETLWYIKVKKSLNGLSV